MVEVCTAPIINERNVAMGKNIRSTENDENLSNSELLCENETKLLILEYLTSSLPVTSTEYDDFPSSGEKLDLVEDDVDTDDVNDKHVYSLEDDRVAGNALRRKGRNLKRSNSYMSVGDFVKRREMIMNWHNNYVAKHFVPVEGSVQRRPSKLKQIDENKYIESKENNISLEGDKRNKHFEQLTAGSSLSSEKVYESVNEESVEELEAVVANGYKEDEDGIHDTSTFNEERNGQSRETSSVKNKGEQLTSSGSNKIMVQLQDSTSFDIKENDRKNNKNADPLKRTPSSKFSDSKKTLERFFRGRESRETTESESVKSQLGPKHGNKVPESCSLFNISVENENLDPLDETDEEGITSYKNFQARRSKVEQMLDPVRKYVARELRKEIVHFDNTRLSPTKTCRNGTPVGDNESYKNSRAAKQTTRQSSLKCSNYRIPTNDSLSTEVTEVKDRYLSYEEFSEKREIVKQMLGKNGGKKHSTDNKREKRRAGDSTPKKEFLENRERLKNFINQNRNKNQQKSKHFRTCAKDIYPIRQKEKKEEGTYMPRNEFLESRERLNNLLKTHLHIPKEVKEILPVEQKDKRKKRANIREEQFLKRESPSQKDAEDIPMVKEKEKRTHDMPKEEQLNKIYSRRAIAKKTVPLHPLYDEMNIPYKEEFEEEFLCEVLSPCGIPGVENKVHTFQDFTPNSYILPDYQSFSNDPSYTPEMYAVDCLEAISNDIMDNYPDMIFGAVHDLLSEPLTYDYFTQFFDSLWSLYENTTVTNWNIWSRIGMVLSVVRESFIFGDLSDSQVETIVHHSTKLVMKYTTENHILLHPLHHMSCTMPHEEEEVEEEFVEVEEIPTSNACAEKVEEKVDRAQDFVYEWIPFMLVILAVGVGVAYVCRKT